MNEPGSAAPAATADWRRGLRVGATFIGVSSLVGAALVTAALTLYVPSGWSRAERLLQAPSVFASSLVHAVGPVVMAGVILCVVGAVTRRRVLLYPTALVAGMLAPVLVYVSNPGPALLFALAGLLSAAVAVWAAARAGD